MSSIRDTLGKFIWDTSRAEGGSMSYIGAKVIADAILAKFNVGVLLMPDPEREEYEAYKAANRGRLRVHRALYPETED